MSTILIEKDVMVPMRDGVLLATDIYRLADAPPQPVLLSRTPYNKEPNLEGFNGFDVLRAAREGYVVAIQDVRGRFGSEGDFQTNPQERQDGYDAVEWLAAQPWSSGRVGMFGGSYVGMTQWMAACEAPPSLGAMAPSNTYADQYDGANFYHGVPLLFTIGWAYLTAVQDVPRRLRLGQPVPEELAAVDFTTVLDHLPLSDHPVLDELAPWHDAWVRTTRPDPLWEAGSARVGYGDVVVPALNIGGWFDLFLRGTIANFVGMTRAGGSEAARSGQRLIIGPWDHIHVSGDFPDRSFGPTGSAMTIDIIGQQLRFFDHHLRDQAPEQVEAPVSIFVMGRNEWRSEPTWPLADTRYLDVHLDSNRGARSVRGDGRLLRGAPGSNGSDTFLSDPLHPVPTRGGQTLAVGANAMGPVRQDDVEQRDDVLVYSTEPLAHEVEVTGHVVLRLHVSSTAPDTDVTGKLVDVDPEGRATILTEGIARLRYRNGPDSPELLPPGTIAELEIDLSATSNVFLRGHQIRLEVASSSFPRFGRNSHTGGAIETETADAYVAAVNTVYFGTDHPSRLVLPVIER